MGTHRGQKSVGSPELELPAVVNRPVVGAGHWTQVFQNSSKTAKLPTSPTISMIFLPHLLQFPFGAHLNANDWEKEYPAFIVLFVV